MLRVLGIGGNSSLHCSPTGGDRSGPGDVLVVAEWDRATRSMFDGISLIERIAKRGALIKVLDKPHLDLTTPIGRGFIAFLARWQRTSATASLPAPMPAGRRGAKGAKFGRKPKLTEHQLKEARKRLDAGESARAISRDFDVHHATVLRVLV